MKSLMKNIFKSIHPLVIGIDSIAGLALLMVIAGSGGGGSAAVGVVAGIAIILIAIFTWGIFSTIISFLYYPVSKNPHILWYAWIKLAIFGIPLAICFIYIANDAHSKAKYLQTPAYAIRTNDLSLLQNLIDNGSDLSQRNLIEEILSRGIDNKFAHQLLLAGYSPSTRDLKEAIERNNPIWGIIFEYGAKDDIAWKKVAIHSAAEYNRDNILKSFMNDDLVFSEIFIAAAIFSRMDVLQELFLRIPIDEKQEFLQVALHEAIISSDSYPTANIAALEFLISKGAVPQKKAVDIIKQHTRGYNNTIITEGYWAEKAAVINKGD